MSRPADALGELTVLYHAPLDIEQIQEILPHRYPFLLVDRVLELDPPQRIVAIKNVTANEPFFQGHFPKRKIMPGVLVIEAMAQAGAILNLCSAEYRGWYILLIGVDNAKFRRPVVPGDCLKITVELKKIKRRMFGVVDCRAQVGGDLVASAEIKFAFSPPQEG